MDIQLIRAGEEGFPEAWSRFVDDHPGAGPFYSPLFLRYLEARKPESFGGNHSFLVTQAGKVLAAVPLVGERANGAVSFSAGGWFNTFYGPLVATTCGRKHARNVLRACFQEIDRLAGDLRATRSYMVMDPLTAYTMKAYWNSLTEHGYLDASINTQVIDLRLDLDMLSAARRSRYKQFINSAKMEFTYQAVDAGNYSPHFSEIYEKLHMTAAGRKTRSAESFRLQDLMVRSGEATYLIAYFADSPIQINFYQHAKGWVYYSSAAPDPDFDDKYAQHGLTWFAVEHFRRVNQRWLELGWQQNGMHLLDIASEKDVNISFFKAGFGGYNIPLFRGIKYYSRDALIQDVNSGCKHVQQIIFGE